MAVLAIFTGVFLLPVILVMRRQRQSEVEPLDLREPLPPEGVKVPVVETSAGWGIRGSGAMVLPSDNSLSPLLRLYTDHLEYRVIARRRASYDQIVRVDGGADRVQNITDELRYVRSRLSLAGEDRALADAIGRAPDT